MACESSFLPIYSKYLLIPYLKREFPAGSLPLTPREGALGPDSFPAAGLGGSVETILRRQFGRLDSIYPVTRASPQMHDCKDDNFVGIYTIKDTKWKPPQQPTPDGLSNNPPSIWIFGDSTDCMLDFSEEVTTETRCFSFVVVRSFKHFLLSGREKDNTCHVDRMSASLKTCSAGLLARLLARYS